MFDKYDEISYNGYRGIINNVYRDNEKAYYSISIFNVSTKRYFDREKNEFVEYQYPNAITALLSKDKDKFFKLVKKGENVDL